MDELLARQTPHSVEAEQAVIGAILFDPTCVPKVVELLQPDDFYIETNRMIFDTISSMFTGGKRIDPVTVLEEMKALQGQSRQGLFSATDRCDTHLHQCGGLCQDRPGKEDASGSSADLQ